MTTPKTLSACFANLVLCCGCCKHACSRVNQGQLIHANLPTREKSPNLEALNKAAATSVHVRNKLFQAAMETKGAEAVRPWPAEKLRGFVLTGVEGATNFTELKAHFQTMKLPAVRAVAAAVAPETPKGSGKATMIEYILNSYRSIAFDSQLSSAVVQQLLDETKRVDAAQSNAQSTSKDTEANTGAPQNEKAQGSGSQESRGQDAGCIKRKLKRWPSKDHPKTKKTRVAVTVAGSEEIADDSATRLGRGLRSFVAQLR